MTKHILHTLILAGLALACTTPMEKDMTPPEILPVGDVASPLNCDVFTPGGVLPFHYLFTDDVALGAFNLEVHSNADHHTHGTEAGECEFEHAHEGLTEKPWVFNKDFAIPAGSTQYEADIQIPIPENIAHGEYHFMIRLTDAAGWQQLRSVGILIDEEE
ncbi:MAG: DUF4625 domain-containing protein [Bacteroidales bacterium]|nr:DUF4625 domain-containing protein [Bacteroidales bacterium]